MSLNGEYFKYTPHDITCTNYQTAIKYAKWSNNTVLGSNIVECASNHTIYKWIIKVEANGWNVGVGIREATALDNINGNFLGGDILHYGYSSKHNGNGSTYSNSNKSEQCDGFKAGSTVKMELDSAKKRIRFYVNNKLMKTMESVKSAKYRLAVMLCGYNGEYPSSVILQSFTSKEVSGKVEEKKEAQKAHNDDNLISELLNKNQKQNEEIQRLKQTHHNFVAQNCELKMTLKQTKEQNVTASLEINAMKSKQEKLNQVITALKEKNQLMQQEQDQLKQENRRITQRVNILEDERKEMERTIIGLKDKIKTLEASALDVNHFREWDSNDVLNWILSIEDGVFNKYEKKLKEEIIDGEITGNDLTTMNIEDIKALGVGKFAHRKLLQNNIQKLTELNNDTDNMDSIDEEGTHPPTAYI